MEVVLEALVAVLVVDFLVEAALVVASSQPLRAA